MLAAVVTVTARTLLGRSRWEVSCAVGIDSGLFSKLSDAAGDVWLLLSGGMERCKELGALVGQRWRHSAVLARSMLWLRRKEAGDATKVRRALMFWTAPAGHARLLRDSMFGKVCWDEGLWAGNLGWNCALYATAESDLAGGDLGKGLVIECEGEI